MIFQVCNECGIEIKTIEQAKAANEREALLLDTFRRMPNTETDHLLGLMLPRTNEQKNKIG